MKKIAILHTGGTFVMESNTDGFLKPGNYAFDYIENSVYPLFPQTKIEQFSLCNIDSSLFKPSHWVLIAEKIEELYKNFDGFVVIHGTDTMAYTSSALSFMLTNLDKPVILTGSQLPLKAKRTDALQNIITSIEVAISSDLKEVCVVFNNKVFRGNRVKKKNTWDFDAFYSPNFPHLISLGIDMERTHYPSLPSPKAELEVQKTLNEKVIIIPFFPGLDFSALFPIVKEKKVDGIVVEAYGSGNIPSDNPGLLELFREAAEKEIPIAVCSQSPVGKVNLSLYEVASQAAYFGLISAVDMTREATLVKLMVALGKFKDLEKVKTYMLSSVAGEKEES